MTDKNGKKLKVGDWVLYNPTGIDNGNLFRAGQISRVSDNFKVLIYQSGDPDPWHRQSSEILKISEEEAMIYLLE